jgi:hypothetical protein
MNEGVHCLRKIVREVSHISSLSLWYQRDDASLSKGFITLLLRKMRSAREGQEGGDCEVSGAHLSQCQLP